MMNVYIRVMLATIIVDVLQVLRQVHMLQQNSYNLDSHLIYLKKHKGDFIGNFLLLIFALLMLLPLQGAMYMVIYLGIIIFLIIIFIQNLPRRMIKKLVYTSRVIRLFVTIFIINLLPFIPVIINKVVSKNNIAIIMIFCSLEMLIVFLANFINIPIEKLCRQKYINEAKKILKDSPSLQIIGITGSYGKTSTKNYLYAILSEKYECLITPESYNTPMGIVRTIREKMKPIHEIFICEMGARRVGDIKEICDIVNPHHGIVTSVGPQHLDTFKKIENVNKTKYELIDSINGIKLVEFDSLLEEYKNKYENIYTFGLNSEATFYAKNIYTTANGTLFTFIDNRDNKATNFHTTLLGNNNIKNLVCCIAFSKLFGMNEDDMIMPVKKIKAVEHRLSLLDDGGMIFIDDAFNSNPVGANEAVNVLSSFDDKTKIIITPGMVELGEKSEELNREFAAHCAKVADYIFLVGKANSGILKDEIEKNGFNKANLIVFNKVHEAIAQARMLVEKNKVCLLENDLPDNY